MPASREHADRVLLIATKRIPAGGEVRFNYENGGRKGTYWASCGRSRPTETTCWRSVLLHPPPPTCHEPIYTDAMMDAPSAHDSFGAAAQQHGAARLEPLSPYRIMGLPPAKPPALTGEEGGADERADGASNMPRDAAASVAVAWGGTRGGDAVLTAVINLLEGSEWLRQCSQRSDGKLRMWQLIATHLPGRTAAECQERWRQLSRSRNCHHPTSTT